MGTEERNRRQRAAGCYSRKLEEVFIEDYPKEKNNGEKKTERESGYQDKEKASARQSNESTADNNMVTDVQKKE